MEDKITESINPIRNKNKQCGTKERIFKLHGKDKQLTDLWMSTYASI